jgi:hypothetical protein
MARMQTRGARTWLGLLVAPAVLASTPPAHAVRLQVELHEAAGSNASADTSSTADSASATADEGTSESVANPVQGDSSPAYYEFAFVSMGAYQTWAIAGRWLYVGAGGGVGPPLYRYSKRAGEDADWDPSLEVAYGNLFIRLQPVPYLDIDVGPKIALISTLDGTVDPPESGFSYAGYVDLRVGSRNIKVGPRFEYGRVAYADAHDKGWRVTPLMLRFIH